MLFGGVHIPDEKPLAKAARVAELPAPTEVAVAMKQSVGRPAIPCVEVGDDVARGQLIGRADGEVSSNVFASISGKVTKVAELENECGCKDTYVVIEGNGEGREQHLYPLTDPTAEEIVARVRDAGIVGLGGA